MNLRKKVCITIFLFILIVGIQIKANAISPKSEIKYSGIDVSNWQGYINYKDVRDSGIDIVYIKASQGTRYKDPYFEINYRNAKRNRLKVGVYHFLTAKNVTEARKEAEFFASVISGKDIDCKLAMDFEQLTNLNSKEVNIISKAFLEHLEDITQKETIIYSDLSNSQTMFNLANEYPIWIAYYGSYNRLKNIKTNWRVWEGQQYTDTGRIKGIIGNVDRDIFTEDILLNNKKEKNITHTVKRGDTLWKIAKKYDTTIKKIVKTNNIKNPDLIYINQVLIIVN